MRLFAGHAGIMLEFRFSPMRALVYFAVSISMMYLTTRFSSLPAAHFITGLAAECRQAEIALPLLYHASKLLLF